MFNTKIKITTDRNIIHCRLYKHNKLTQHLQFINWDNTKYEMRVIFMKNNKYENVKHLWHYFLRHYKCEYCCCCTQDHWYTKNILQQLHFKNYDNNIKCLYEWHPNLLQKVANSTK